jgi:hypothetical protein
MEKPSVTKRNPTAEELVAEFAAQTDAIWNGAEGNWKIDSE